MRKLAMRNVATLGLLLLPAALGAQGDKIDAYMKAEMEKASIPGASVVVMKAGNVLHHGSYGVASIELSVPVTQKTVFPLASITKTFAATAVMLLVERNTLSLDGTLGSILPNVPESWKAITVRQLLGHTSGLPDVVVNPVTGTWLGDTREAALEKLSALPLQAKPGETWSYNQTNYMLLGMIVEARSGMPFDEFLKRHVLEPLSPGAFVYGDSKVIVPDRGSWYSIIDFSSGRPKRAKAVYPTSVTYPSFIHTAAGLNATALDLARFAEAVAHGRILKKETADKMWTAVSLADGTTFRMEKTLGVGLGWVVDDVPGHRSVGGTGGSSVAFRHFRDDNLTVVVLTNLQGVDPDAMCDAIARFYIPGA
jgi:CubicO group peptidase (beta-lactamase class C family)